MLFVEYLVIWHCCSSSGCIRDCSNGCIRDFSSGCIRGCSNGCIRDCSSGCIRNCSSGCIIGLIRDYSSGLYNMDILKAIM